MLLAKRAVYSPKGVVFHFLLKQNNNQVLCPISYRIIAKRSEQEDFLQNTRYHGHIKRPLHITKVCRDIESGLRAIGGGLAACGAIGSGIGLGVIFGNLLNAIARNPSISNKAFTNAIVGAAFTESVGLFCLAVSFILSL